mmetsp:Transcript_13625/g.26310  ORF Transcript_13625/g.26310 Transcript_13625/m.26310 type:complete len:347 (-) Transcript_13625:127-1167(-)|eukprot:CAMPEP_0171519534 /NCGR_PEP_ID=MMETSP0959-20130129/5947_1 /TAXON_ID=87120 /ORGANISM="Aurantiochytrium limacinum, Strain ATCCMYA-1381" /LENGTH=346 /DNA_ID=CAMNT_0012058969 /DNA_START=185 /DNA_END=1225 /DNA_ORIENTATION=-
MATQLRVWMGLYLFSGVMQPLLMDQVKYMGATSEWPPTLLPLLARCVGMYFVKFVAELLVKLGITEKSLGRPQVQDKVIYAETESGQLSKKLLAVAVAIDISSGMLTTSGLLLVGSGVYTVIYSSTTAFTAVMSWFLGQHLVSGQIISIAMITMGLVINGLAVIDAAGSASSAEALHVALGIICVLLGTVLHAAAYVFNERVIKTHNVSPFVLCSQMGAVEASLLAIYNLGLITVYGSDFLYLDSIRATGTSSSDVAIGYLALMFMDSLHALSFFAMLGQLGAVTTGVLKSLLAVSVFSFAAIFFCDKEATQCFSVMKAASLLVVLFGSAAYRISTDQARVMERAK